MTHLHRLDLPQQRARGLGHFGCQVLVPELCTLRPPLHVGNVLVRGVCVCV